MLWIDTHCHLDAHEFGAESLPVAQRAGELGVGMIVIPAVEQANFAIVRELAHAAPNGCYALGIHPIYVPHATDDDLLALREAVAAAMTDPRFVAIGEIGLDFFIPMLSGTGHARQAGALPARAAENRPRFRLAGAGPCAPLAGYRAETCAPDPPERRHRPCLQRQLSTGARLYRPRFQARLRRRHDLYPRLADTPHGHRLAACAPSCWKPMRPIFRPAWIHPGRNSPEQLPRIGAVLAELRGIELADVAAQTSANARAAMPRLPLMESPHE